MDAADLAWNRACELVKGFLPGSQALAAMVLADGLVNNGGVFHALEALSTKEVRATLAAYRYFGLGKVAALLEEAGAVPETSKAEKEADMDARYDRLVGVLQGHFRTHFAAHPDAYDPL